MHCDNADLVPWATLHGSYYAAFLLYCAMYQNMLVSLQEVVWGPAGNHWFSSARAGVELQAVIKLVGRRMAKGSTYKVYLRCSSISMIAAWLPHL